MRSSFIAIGSVCLLACGGTHPPADPATGAASAELAPQATATTTAVAATVSASATASAAPHAPRALPITVDGTKLRCAQDRCRGEVDFRGQIRFQKIDPETIARWAQEAELALVDRGAKFSSERYELRAPALHEVFASRAAEDLVLPDDGPNGLMPVPSDAIRVGVELELRFPDGVVARGQVALADRAIRLGFGEWMRTISKGPLALPGEPAYEGAPRAMWVEFPNEVRGSARSAAELDWVLVFDDVKRTLDCERRKKGKTERASFQIDDVRGRVFERRTGKLVGEKTLPDPGAPKCSEFFQLLDEDIGGALGMRDKTAFVQIANWAWSTLRAGTP